MNQPANPNPLSNSTPTSPSESGAKESFQISAPSISLPKGGGAIRGIDEKFSANRATGTGSLTIPLRLSPGRSGFGPQLALQYDSGSGNGPFGMGWSLPIPMITRRSDKGLPQYRDAEESDIFILSGSEDLVPVLRRSAQAASRKRLPGDGWRLFDVRHEFPDAWQRLTECCEHDTVESRLRIRFERRMFPFVPGTREVCIGGLAILFTGSEHDDCDACRHCGHPAPCGCPCP